VGQNVDSPYPHAGRVGAIRSPRGRGQLCMSARRSERSTDHPRVAGTTAEGAATRRFGDRITPASRGQLSDGLPTCCEGSGSPPRRGDNCLRRVTLTSDPAGSPPRRGDNCGSWRASFPRTGGHPRVAGTTSWVVLRAHRILGPTPRRRGQESSSVRRAGSPPHARGAPPGTMLSSSC
jgi:hypothetical protein